jgi:hypothetical protein
MTVSTDAPQTGRGSVRGVLVAAGVALAVCLLAALGSRHEILHAWGLSGEPGTYVVDSCGVVDDDQESLCTGTFTPDDGAPDVTVDLRGEHDAGDRFAASLRDDGEAYRADARGRLVSVTVPLLPLVFVAFVPYLVHATRRRGRLGKVGFVVFGLLPPAFVLLLFLAGMAASL